METKHLIESLLFVSGKPVSIVKLTELLGCTREQTVQAADDLMREYADGKRGVQIQKTATSYQMATSPDASGTIQNFVKAEQTGELTKPSLETLTIIAYRGPITKAELEQIRGVNCSLILRNLLIKGLIETRDDRGKMAAVYTVTFEFLRFLGLHRVEELPDYAKLNQDENLKKLLERKIEDQPHPGASGPVSA
ncbi:MAG: SMC-Scp complex subunit ScpB [Patescibacteria group bacterium]|nr:SMC-Scp complex subunit ScpB [Patescibacteria group bacterium]MDD5715334.1 SMC-Scp complex subunit ScpB [Patescibacteria group bacterium]